MNGDALNRKLLQSDAKLPRILKDPRLTDETLIKGLYLLTFCRPPSPEEVTEAKTIFAETASRSAGAQDLFWALLNSKEFLFNH